MSEQSPAATQPTDAAADATTETPAEVTKAEPAAVTGTTALSTGEVDPKAATAAEGEDKPTDQPAPKAPEKYELTPPEGMTLEPETTKQFEALARELDLSNEDANKLIPLGAQLAQKIGEQQQAAHVAQVAKWLDETKADKEIGGEKFEGSLKVAMKAVDRFATPGLKTLMDQTGLGNNPEFVRLFHRIGQAIAEDKFVVAPTGGAGKAPLADRLFPSSSK